MNFDELDLDAPRDEQKEVRSKRSRAQSIHPHQDVMVECSITPGSLTILTLADKPVAQSWSVANSDKSGKQSTSSLYSRTMSSDVSLGIDDIESMEPTAGEHGQNDDDVKLLNSSIDGIDILVSQSLKEDRSMYGVAIGDDVSINMDRNLDLDTDASYRARMSMESSVASSWATDGGNNDDHDSPLIHASSATGTSKSKKKSNSMSSDNERSGSDDDDDDDDSTASHEFKSRLAESLVSTRMQRALGEARPANGAWWQAAAFPAPRVRHTATTLGNGLVLVFGGMSPRGGSGAVHCFADVWTLDSTRWRWHEHTNIVGDVPPPRYGHSATYVSDLTTESVLSPRSAHRSKVPSESNSNAASSSSSSSSPPPSVNRFGFEALGKPGANPVLVVFGGRTNLLTTGSGLLNDVYVLHLREMRWECLMMAGEAPSPRCYHSACRLNKLASEALLDTEAGGERRGRREGSRSRSRSRQRSTSSRRSTSLRSLRASDGGASKKKKKDSDDDDGAGDGDSSSGGDDVQVPSCVAIFGGQTGDGSARDLHVLNVGERRWVLPRVSGRAPKKRYGHFSFMYGGHHMVVCGGISKLLSLHDDVVGINFAKSPPVWIHPRLRNSPAPAKGTQLAPYWALVGNKLFSFQFEHLSSGSLVYLDIDDFTWKLASITGELMLNEAAFYTVNTVQDSQLFVDLSRARCRVTALVSIAPDASNPLQQRFRWRRFDVVLPPPPAELLTAASVGNGRASAVHANPKFLPVEAELRHCSALPTLMPLAPAGTNSVSLQRVVASICRCLSLRHVVVLYFDHTQRKFVMLLTDRHLAIAVARSRQRRPYNILPLYIVAARPPLGHRERSQRLNFLVREAEALSTKSSSSSASKGAPSELAVDAQQAQSDAVVASPDDAAIGVDAVDDRLLLDANVGNDVGAVGDALDDDAPLRQTSSSGGGGSDSRRADIYQNEKEGDDDDDDDAAEAIGGQNDSLAVHRQQSVYHVRVTEAKPGAAASTRDASTRRYGAASASAHWRRRRDRRRRRRQQRDGVASDAFDYEEIGSGEDDYYSLNGGGAGDARLDEHLGDSDPESAAAMVFHPARAGVLRHVHDRMSKLEQRGVSRILSQLTPERERSRFFMWLSPATVASSQSSSLPMIGDGGRPAEDRAPLLGAGGKHRHTPSNGRLPNEESPFSWRVWLVTLLQTFFLPVSACVMAFTCRYGAKALAMLVLVSLYPLVGAVLLIVSHTYAPVGSATAGASIGTPGEAFGPIILWMLLSIIFATIEASWQGGKAQARRLRKYRARVNQRVGGELELDRVTTGEAILFSLTSKEKTSPDKPTVIIYCAVFALVGALLHCGTSLLFMLLEGQVVVSDDWVVHITVILLELSNFCGVSVLLFSLGVSLAVYQRQLLHMSYFSSLTEQRSRQRRSGIPHMPLKNTENIMCWMKVRNFLMQHSSLPVGSANIILGWALVAAIVLWIIVVVEVFVNYGQSGRQLFDGYLIMVVADGIILGVYIAVGLLLGGNISRHIANHSELLLKERVKLVLEEQHQRADIINDRLLLDESDSKALSELAAPSSVQQQPASAQQQAAPSTPLIALSSVMRSGATPLLASQASLHSNAGKRRIDVARRALAAKEHRLVEQTASLELLTAMNTVLDKQPAFRVLGFSLGEPGLRIIVALFLPLVIAVSTRMVTEIARNSN
jgi:Galactose oxidase, central domain